MTTIAVSAWSLDVEPPDRAVELLGRKGLRFKDDATKRALCVVREALDEGPRPTGCDAPADPGRSVVVASNLAIVAAARRVVSRLSSGSARTVSPMDAPNVSANVVASTIAIRFGCGGPSVTVISGSAAGLDAVAAAARLLRAGRCKEAIVVGVEPGDPDAIALHSSLGAGNLRSLAACVVLHTTGAATRPGDPVIDRIRWCQADGGPLSDDRIAGDAFGAQGVADVARAAERVASGVSAVDVSCGDDRDGWRSLVVRRNDLQGGGALWH